MNKKYYYINANQEKVGPLNAAQLRNVDGLELDTEVCSEEELEDWKPLMCDEELNAVFLKKFKSQLNAIKFTLGFASIWVCGKYAHNKIKNIVGIFTSSETRNEIMWFFYLSMTIPIIAIMSAPIVSIFRFKLLRTDITILEESQRELNKINVLTNE